MVGQHRDTSIKAGEQRSDAKWRGRPREKVCHSVSFRGHQTGQKGLQAASYSHPPCRFRSKPFKFHAHMVRAFLACMCGHVTKVLSTNKLWAEETSSALHKICYVFPCFCIPCCTRCDDDPSGEPASSPNSTKQPWGMVSDKTEFVMKYSFSFAWVILLVLGFLLLLLLLW